MMFRFGLFFCTIISLQKGGTVFVEPNRYGTIGIPRAMLFYRYGHMWQAFFEALDIDILLSPPTGREILESGISTAEDETCLSAKIFMGHVRWLLGKCDAIFVPRYSSYGRDEVFCTRFEGLYDQTRNVFRGSMQRFLSFNIDVKNRQSEENAFLSLARELGYSVKAGRRAYAAAVKADEQRNRELLRKQEELYRKPGMKILLGGHGYILSDQYIGRPIQDYLERAGAVPIRADICDRRDALRESVRFSPTCRWVMSREIIGGILQQKKHADGIILVSAFPCGPDSMTNELLARKIRDIPILHLVVDAQSGIAGMETRLESFIDIIQFRQGASS